MVLFSVAVVGFLAYANGANDNFKGVATLYGSGTMSFRAALWIATVATALGSLAALLAAQGLLATFSGKGLVPDAVLGIPSFALAVVLAAASTVMLATKLGFPISTTHALTGALVGAGLFASDGGVNFAKLGTAFFLPLLLSPLAALCLAGLGYGVGRWFAGAAAVEESCVCVGQAIEATPVAEGAGCLAREAAATPSLKIASEEECAAAFDGPVWSIGIRGLLDQCHLLSAAAVCFARALNDTPKIAAMLLIASVVTPDLGMVLVALLMAVGGLFHSRDIAETMSHRVTEMDPRQGFAANLTTSLLVIGASLVGMPVSTTHVSCGSLFGIGIATGRGHASAIVSILLAWVVTLPVAAVLGLVYFNLLGWLL